MTSHHNHLSSSASSQLGVQGNNSTLGKRKLPGNWPVADRTIAEGSQSSTISFDTPQHAFISARALQQADNTHEELPVLMSNVEHNVAIRHFQESEAAMLDSYGSYRGRMNIGDFNINYDDGESSSRLDYGSGDLDKQCVCFELFVALQVLIATIGSRTS